MKIAIKYKAKDGTEFNSFKKYRMHEKLTRRICKIFSSLKKRPDNAEFMYGKYFIQQDIDIVNNVRIMLLAEIQSTVDHSGFIVEVKDVQSMDSNSITWLINHLNNKIIYSAWDRIMCIDKTGREWGQYCYVKNPPTDQLIR